MRLMMAIAAVAVGVYGASAEPDKLSQRFGLVHGEGDFCAELGSGWTRHDFTWEGIEREKGKFDFGELPARVDRFLGQGVMLLPILDYNPAWDRERSPADDETRAAFANYAVRCIKQFPQLRYWQVWNEPNLAFWKPDPSAYDYAELLRVTYEAAKAADPGVQILGFNCSDIDLEFTEQVARYGGLRYCDILAFQPYRIAPEVGHFEEMEALRKLVARFNGEQKPIWFTEMGWATQHFPMKEAPGLDLLEERPARRQSAYLVRYMVIICATGVEKVFWFSQAADGAGLEDHAQNKKRLTFYAYQHLIQLLDNYTSVRELVPHGAFGRYAYLFDCPERDVVVAWSVNGPQELTLDGLGAAREARDVLGKPLPNPASNSISVTGEPVYYIFDHAPEALRVRTDYEIEGRYWAAPGESIELHVSGPQGTRDGRVHFAVDGPRGVRTASSIVHNPGDTHAAQEVRISPKCPPGRQTVRIREGNSAWDVELNVVPRKLWTYQGESEGYLTPVTDPLRFRPEILVAAYDSSEILALTPAGARAWQYREGAPVNSSLAAVAKHTRYDYQPFMAGAMPGRQTLFLLYAGVLQWRVKLDGEAPKDTPGWDWTHPVAGDLNRDGVDEILYADSLGVVWCLSLDGKVMWRQKVSDARCDRPVFVSQVTGSEEPEVVAVDAGGKVYCLDYRGQPLWTAETGADITAAPVAGSLTEGEPPALFVANRDEKLVRLNGTGGQVWSAPLDGTMDLGAGIVLADLDGDHTSEIVASTRDNHVCAFDGSGKKLWQFEAGAQIRSIPAVGDVDGDGAVEVLVGAADWLLYCIDGRGRVEWTYNTGNRIDASPLLVDLDADRIEDIVLPVRGGKILALSAAGKR